MRIEATAAEVGDVVLDDAGECWRKDGAPEGTEVAFWSTFGVQGGAMGGASLPAPTGTVALLVRGGKQMCCTPDPEPVTQPTS